MLFVLFMDFLFRNTNVESPKGECDPSALAEVVFRDLVCRASYGNIRSVILPVLL